MPKEFECSVSFTYDAESPVDAAQQFIDNIRSNPNWFVSVKETKSGEKFTVDTESGEAEKES